MPPKRSRAPVPQRGEETQRLPGNGGPALGAAAAATSSTAAAVHSASARRPHHLVSRLHPPWGNTATTPTSGPALRTSGITPNALSTTGSKGGTVAAATPQPPHRSAEQASDTAAHASTRRGTAALLPTRLSGGGRVNGRGAGGGRSAAGRRPSKATTVAARAAAVTAARKRPRSTSTASSSSPLEIAEGEDVDGGDEGDVRCSDGGSPTSGAESTAHGVHALPEVTQLSSSSASSVSSSSPSLSPSPVVTERKVWKAGGSGNQRGLGDAARHTNASTAGAPASSTAAAAVQSGCTAADVRAASPPTALAATTEGSVTPANATEAGAAASAPTHHTAASTADSKVLFADDEDEEAEQDNGGGGVGSGVWGAMQRRTDTRTAPAAEETHVLGELSENASVTPARPAAPPLLAGTPTGSGSTGDSGDAARRHGCMESKTGAGDEEDVLGEPREAPEPNRGHTEGPPDEADAARRQRAVTPSRPHTATPHGENTPAPRSARAPSATAAAAALAAAAAAGAATFAETLAVQDLSLLAEESGNSGGHKTAATAAAAAAAAVAPHVAHGAEEMLLGDGLASPPVKRVTATPQEAAHDTSRAAAGSAQAVVVQTGNPRQRLVMDGASASSDGSLATLTPAPPRSPRAEALEAAAQRDRSRENGHAATRHDNAQTATGPSHPAPSSLPSTPDDGLWKGGEEAYAEGDRPETRAAVAEAGDVDALALTPRRSTASQESSDSPMTPLARRRAHGEPDADAAAAATAAWLSAADGAETVPIDPFLSTPPQLKRASQVRRSGATAAVAPSEMRDGVRKGVRSSPARPGRGGAAGRGKDGNARGASSTPSRTPPRSATPQPPPPPRPPTHPHAHAPVSADATAAVVTGADVDAGVLVTGLRVEGRWGRQWFPATISEAPRNGFVQIAWEEDGSRLHLRLREVRLQPANGDAALKNASRTPVTSRTGLSPAREQSATPAGGRHDKHMLTATQLVALMEEEDEEDSRHEPEPPHLPKMPAAAAAVARRTAAAAEATRPGERGGEAAEGPLDPSRETGVHVAGTPAADTAGTPLRARRARSALRATGAHDSASRSPARPPVSLPPGEVHPSALCIVLPQSARRELLQGDAFSASVAAPSSSADSLARPPPHAGPATELQRSTELQRLLHFLSSAGAAVVDSLAQADNMAAQMSEQTEALAEAGEGRSEHPIADALPVSSTATTTTSQATTAVGGGSSSATKRKTVGRVPLPRRSSIHAGGAAASIARASAPRHFIFLVATSDVAALAGDALAEVTLAHALGVSAVHVSWLWTIAPGTPHVRLPTALDEVSGAALTSTAGGAGEKGAERGKRTGAVRRPSASPSPAPDAASPPRLAPFAVRDRVLGGREVLFLERDDRMETWLNAAGAAVRAAPTPGPTTAAACARMSRTSVLAAAGSANRSGDAAVAARRRRSESPAPKAPRVERVPDYVYAPVDRPAPAVVDLDRLGGVPVLTLAWLAASIEQHYRQHGGGEASPAVASDAMPPPPAVLAEVWPTLQHALLQQQQQQQRERSVQHPATPPRLQSPLQRTPPQTEAPVQTAEPPPPPVAMAPRTEAAAVLSSGTATSPARAEAERTAAEPSTTDVAPPTERVGAEAKTVEDMSAEEEAPQREMGVDVRDAREDTEVANAPADAAAAAAAADAASAYTPAVAATDVAMYDADATPAACTAHPAIAVGEDYYVTLSAAVMPPHPQEQQQQQQQQQQGPSQQRGPSMLRFPPPVVPATTIVLGRVVDLQLHPAAPGPLSPSACGCRVVLQLYEPKYVSMHVDPRSHEVVHQTTVYLAPRWATAPGAALLFDTPVYVINTAARQHVYLLEDAPETAEEPHAQTAVWGTPNRVHGRDDAPAHGSRGRLSGSPLTPPVHEAGGSPLSPDVSRQRDRARLPGASGVPPVTARVTAIRAAQPSRGRGTPSRGDGERQRNWALHGTETLPLTPVVAVPPPPLSSSAGDEPAHGPGKGGGLQTGRGATAPVPDARPSSAADGNRGAASAASPRVGSASSPITFDLAPQRDAPRHGPITATRDGGSSADDTSPPARPHPSSRLANPRTPMAVTAVAATSPLRASHLLPELPLRLGAHTVMLRPDSQVSFYARRSLSVSDRASGRPSLASAQDGSVHRSTPPRHHRVPAGSAAHEHGEMSDVDSDSSEELIAEAPLIGKVEQMREMESGVVDIVVLTAQPNSVFGGSKMYRITPDMIVDVSP